MSLPYLHNYVLTFPDGTRWRTGYVYGVEGWAEQEANKRYDDERQAEIEKAEEGPSE